MGPAGSQVQGELSDVHRASPQKFLSLAPWLPWRLGEFFRHGARRAGARA
jgi:hypothetical protein